MAHIEHLFGETSLGLAADQALVVCVVKDGEPWIQDFIEHYFSLGFAHIVFLDNGSTDRTIEIARAYSNVTMLKSEASFSENKTKFKFTLIKNFGIGCWSLIADIDEFFYYPDMDSVDLNSFLRYQNMNNYNCVIAQMIDMVPDLTLGQLIQNPILKLQDAEWYFDLSDIEKRAYQVEKNEIANGQIQNWYGGVRKRLFDLQDLLLTKHPMIFGSGEIVFLSSHTVSKRSVSDVSSVFLHYKYLGDVADRATTAIKAKNYYNESAEYKRYKEVFEGRPASHFLTESAVLFLGSDSLADSSLFETTHQYTNHINTLI
jgi:glycosyltransferase involved in cell wall biosynthesis